MNTLENQRQQLGTTLTQFYSKPVAQVSIELFLSIGTVVFFALFAIRPTLVTMSDLIKEIEEKRELSSQLSKKIAALSTGQSEYASLEDRLVVLDEAIPSNPQLLTTLKTLEKIASEKNVIITSISTSEVPPEMTSMEAGKQERVTLPLSLAVTGEYTDIRSFAEELQKSRRTVILDTITFSTSEERGYKKLRAVVNIGLPYFGDPS